MFETIHIPGDMIHQQPTSNSSVGTANAPPPPSHMQYAVRTYSLGIPKLGLDAVPHFYLVQEVKK